MNIGMWNPRAARNAAGGTETFVRNIASELSDRDDTDVTLYSSTNGHVPSCLETVNLQQIRTIPKESVANRLLSRGPLLNAEIESLSSYTYSKLSRCLNPDHDVLTTHYYLDAVLLSRAVDIPVAFRLPGIKQESPRWTLVFGYTDVDQYISNSPTTTERVRAIYNRELSGPIYAGVDPERFQPTQCTRESRVLFVGRLGKGKGVRRLVEAAKLLKGISVRIVGDGPLRDKLEREAPANVKFVGTVPHNRIHKEYQRATCLVLPTVHEAFPVCVIEALATGTPVVATDIDATRLTIDDGKTGILLQNREPQTIAEAIETVCWEPYYQHHAKTSGRQTAKEYSWQEQATRFRKVLQKCVT